VVIIALLDQRVRVGDTDRAYISMTMKAAMATVNSTLQCRMTRLITQMSAQHDKLQACRMVGESG
jgi:hypothetical protein